MEEKHSRACDLGACITQVLQALCSAGRFSILTMCLFMLRFMPNFPNTLSHGCNFCRQLMIRLVPLQNIVFTRTLGEVIT